MDTKLLYLALALVTLAGCQSYPMGLSKTEWETLPPEQQAEYRHQQSLIDEQRRREQAVIDEQRRKEQAEITAREQAVAAERARQEELRLAALYAHARQGDIVTVTIQNGLIDFGKHRPYEPLRFDILRGEHKLVEVCQQGNSQVKTLVPVFLSEDGQTFYFDENARDRIVLINAGNAWQAGKKYESQTIMDKHSKSIASAISIHLQYKDLVRGNGPRPAPSRPSPNQPLKR
jgi:ATPase subunit of ABC transporter with duplicated ATPase domains